MKNTNNTTYKRKSTGYRYKMSDEMWGGIVRFLDEVWRNPKDTPDSGVLLSLQDREISKLFTKKRIELMNTISYGRLESVSELSEKVGRQLSAVERDLKILNDFGIVELEKKGRIVKPVIKANVLILPILLPAPTKIPGLLPASS